LSLLFAKDWLTTNVILIIGLLNVKGNQRESREYFHGSNGIWCRFNGFDFTVLKYRKIKTFQVNNFTVSSALVIKLKVVE
jgi:hypothetical protein